MEGSLLKDVTKRLINTSEQLFDFGIHLDFGLDDIFQQQSNFPNSVESAALALANEWWKTSSDSQERKIEVLTRCPEALKKPNLKVEVEDIIAKYDKKGTTNQEETIVKTLETRSPGATGACALPQSPGATDGAESQGACALPQSLKSTGGAESQGACALPQCPGATGGAESQGACALPQFPGATGGVESQGVCVLPPIQSFSSIEKSDIRIQNKTGDAVSQPISEEEEVGYPPTTGNAKRKGPGPKEVSATDNEEDVESATPEFPDMPRPQSQQLPLMQYGGTQVLNHSYADEKTENTTLSKSHDHDNDDAEDATLPGNASDASTKQSPDSDFSSDFDDSYPTQLLNMANGNNVDLFDSNISKSRGSHLTNGTADP